MFPNRQLALLQQPEPRPSLSAQLALLQQPEPRPSLSAQRPVTAAAERC